MDYNSCQCRSRLVSGVPANGGRIEKQSTVSATELACCSGVAAWNKAVFQQARMCLLKPGRFTDHDQRLQTAQESKLTPEELFIAAAVGWILGID